jgi:hypothetical protein
MPLNQDEVLLVEAFETMLSSGDGLGLNSHQPELEELGERERGLEYLHNQIDEMFHHKTADLSHHDGICAAFSKVHSYKYIDDPTFEAAMNKELTAQGIPADQRERALNLVPAIIEELRGEKAAWAEKDAGLVDMDEIREASFPDNTQTATG